MKILGEPVEVVTQKDILSKEFDAIGVKKLSKLLPAWSIKWMINTNTML